jgi:hypothetical protein
MIASLRWPKPARPSGAIQRPSPSGPRAAILSRIAISVARPMGALCAAWAKKPAKPHMMEA